MKSDQWGARRKKFQNQPAIHLQNQALLVPAAQTEARERMTSKEEPIPSGLSRFQLSTRTEQTTVQAFQELS